MSIFEHSDMTFTHCVTCGVKYGMPTTLYNHQRKSGGYHHCPNGHSQGWSKTECEDARVRRERDQLKQRVAQKDDEIREERERREAVERRLTAAKGQITRVRNRVGNGVCPCCTRSFANLQRHMQTQHPTFKCEPAEPELKVINGGAA